MSRYTNGGRAGPGRAVASAVASRVEEPWATTTSALAARSRSDEGTPDFVRVTADPTEGEAYFESGSDVVAALPMAPEIEVRDRRCGTWRESASAKALAVSALSMIVQGTTMFCRLAPAHSM